MYYETKRPQYMWISRLITVTYLPFFFCDGEEAQPKNLHVVNLQFLLSPELSQSVKGGNDLVQMDMLHLART